MPPAVVSPAIAALGNAFESPSVIAWISAGSFQCVKIEMERKGAGVG